MHEQVHEHAPEQVREQAPPTEQVPVQPSAGTEAFARPSSGTSYGAGTSGQSSGTASWASGSYGSPSAEPSTTSSTPTASSPYGRGDDDGAPTSGSYGGAYGAPYAGSPGVPTPPWGGQAGGWPGAPGAPGAPTAPASPGFFTSLFDTSFDRFVTPVVAKVAYLVVIVAVGLTWVANVVGALLADPPYGLVVLVVGGVIALVTVIGARVLIEAVLALIRLSEDTRALREKADGGSSS